MAILRSKEVSLLKAKKTLDGTEHGDFLPAVSGQGTSPILPSGTAFFTKETGCLLCPLPGNREDIHGGSSSTLGGGE